MDASLKTETVTRRSFLGYGIAAVGAFVGSVVGLASGVFAASPVFTQKRGSDVDLGPITAFQVGVPKFVDFPVQRKDGWITEDTTKSVWVVRTGENSFTTYNPKCTHLGCVVSWFPDSKTFRSPCHGGVFSIDGQVQAGPPPRALDRLESRVEGGKLIVSYRDFRLGVPEKVEA